MSDTTDDWAGLAALHALGLLDGEERSRFESRLQDDAAARDELVRLAEAAAALGGLAPESPPPPRLKQRLLSAIRAEAAPPPAQVALSPGIAVVFAGRMDWQETGLPGIRVKTLHFDAARNYASNLVSMAAGSVYPSHWHAQTEELLMLSGNITLSGHRLGPGDYCRADPGTLHEEVHAETDCTFLALVGLDNQFRPAPAPS